MLAEAQAGLKAKANPLYGNRRLELPNTAGKPDAGGLTEEMRKVLARQNAPGNEQ
jgi:hypothetical protein